MRARCRHGGPCDSVLFATHGRHAPLVGHWLTVARGGFRCRARGLLAVLSPQAACLLPSVRGPLWLSPVGRAGGAGRCGLRPELPFHRLSTAAVGRPGSTAFKIVFSRAIL